MNSTSLSHNARKRGFKSITLTGFEAGLHLKEKGDGTYRFSCLTERLESLIEEKDIIFITGFEALTSNGFIIYPGETDIFPLLAEMTESLNARAVELVKGKEGIFTFIPLYLNISGDNGMETDNRLQCKPGRTMRNTRIAGSLETMRVVSDILAVLNVGEFSMQFPSEINRADSRLSLLKLIAARSISLDMINICYDQLNFIVRAQYSESVESILKTQGIDYTCSPNMAKVSINGVRMKGTPGVMARIYGALESERVEVIRNTDSHTTISCLICETSLSHALNALKNEFELSNREITYEGL